MVDMATIKSIWQTLIQLASMLIDRWHVLYPVWRLLSGEESSMEEIDSICNLYNLFEEAIDATSKLDWGQSTSLTADYATLYGHLGVIEHLDVELRWLEDHANGLTLTHDTYIHPEGCRPNDVVPSLLHQPSRSLSRLLQPIDSYRPCVRDRIKALTRHAVRLLVVLDLPDELLMQIFHFVRCCPLRPGYGHGHTPETRDIQNARLICR
ncbi:hypothetical protein F5B21DRAFT_33901 [Xylaria acuta]|nr:hypothetical protein F5B21DRAFT_33901 [Xylaria acuta]